MIVGDRMGTESTRRAFDARITDATEAVEFVIPLLALQSGSIPPAAHLELRDPELELDHVPEGARHGMKLSAVLSNSFAFGGTNTVLVACRADRASRMHRG